MERRTYIYVKYHITEMEAKSDCSPGHQDNILTIMKRNQGLYKFEKKPGQRALKNRIIWLVDRGKHFVKQQQHKIIAAKAFFHCAVKS